MEERRPDRHPRTQQFLDTVAFGSLLVFASVTPPLSPERDATAERPSSEARTERFTSHPDEAVA
jgi:hypothetical protein